MILPWYTQKVNHTVTPEIKKKMKFDSFGELKFYLAYYAVSIHIPFSVVYSDKGERYEVLCKQVCLWRV